MKNVNQAEWQELIANDIDAVIIDTRTPRESVQEVLLIMPL